MNLREEADRIFRRVMRISEDATIDAITQKGFARWDSLRHAELIIRLQNRFGMRFPVEEIQKIDSVEKMREAVERRANPD